MSLLRRIPALFLLLLAAPAAPQEPQRLTFEIAVERSKDLLPVLPVMHWVPGSHDASFVETKDKVQVLNRLTAGGGEAKVICDAAKVLAALGEKVAVDQPLTFPAWSWVDATTLRFVHKNAVWTWTPGADKATRILQLPHDLDGGEDSSSIAFAPGDQHVAFVRGNDLHLTDRAGTVRRLTWDGTEDIVYGGGAHRQEFGITGGLFWSPDGHCLAFYREDLRPIALYPYSDLDSLPPKPAHGRYPMAGRAQSQVQVGVYDVTTGTLAWLEHDPAADLFWTNVTFAADGKTMTVALVNRGQDRMQLVRFDCATGKRLATLLEEQDPQWIEPEHQPIFLKDGRFLWWSPRDGHRHLYQCAEDGKLLGQVTRGAFDVQAFLGLNADQTGLWFLASGEDPRQRHLFFAKLDGSEVHQVTRERGTHACSLAPDGQFAFDAWSNLATAPMLQFLALQANTVEALPAPANPLAAFHLPTSRMFQVKAEDDTVLYGQLLLPPDLQEAHKYPVLLYVYGGPHEQLVTDSYLGGAALWLHALAAEGYVVCWLDNRGTPNRGIEFEQCIHRRLGTLEVQDQLRAVEYLKTLPYVDPARIGVHGWSYGGYMTLRLLLLSPDMFACGVSGAPVTDWKMYETGFTERYMDTPAENPDGYEASSCLPLAKNLKAHLLLVQGTDDKTVMWSHSLAFVRRCIDAGVLLDYFPYPMQKHGLKGQDRKHFLRLMKRFLDAQLHPGT